MTPPQQTGCGKVSYPSRAHAEQAALNLALLYFGRRGRSRVNTAYRCPDCGQWHRTSKRNGK